VQGSHLQAITQRDAHDRIDLVFEHDYITHDHGIVCHPLKCCPRGEAHGRRQPHAGGADSEITTWHADFEHPLCFIPFAFGARELLDFGGVGFVSTARLGSTPHTNTQQAQVRTILDREL
jgi:hypothetical protein